MQTPMPGRAGQQGEGHQQHTQDHPAYAQVESKSERPWNQAGGTQGQVDAFRGLDLVAGIQWG